MKKILIGLSILLLMSGCGNEEHTLSCSSTTETNGITTNTKYEIKYLDDEVKHVKITYDYNQNNNQDNNMDGTNADTDGISEDTTNNNNDLNSDDVVDGVVGDTIDGIVDGVTDTILDISGIRNRYQNQLDTFNNVEGFSYKVDVDNDNEYKIIYEIDMDKIDESELTRFNVTRDFSDIKSNYQNLGYTCE